MYYEVFIPSPDQDDFDVTITVDAENWMAALKSGLERTGAGTDVVRNVMCDIKDDNTIHVTDATTQRVFVLQELTEQQYRASQRETDSAEPSEQTHATPPGRDDAEVSSTRRVDIQRETAVSADEQPGVDQQVQDDPPVVPTAEEGVGNEHSYTGGEGRLRIGSSTQEALKRDEQDAEVVRETRTKSDQAKAVDIGRDNQKVSESIIEDIFLEIQDIHEGAMEMEEVVQFVMDMAVDKIEAESASILFADVNGRELYFATARGPKANEVMDYRVPMGEGIVGFCTREGVSLAISDAPNDPRFYREISESIGYETRGLLCAPLEHNSRVYGAIELMNAPSGAGFSTNEMNALTYLGRQLAKFVYDTIMRREQIDDP